MREIKYKVWYKPLGVMIEPEKLVFINFDTKVIGVYIDMDGKGYHVLRMSDFELMQYTGLKDRNGVDIYEGDIIKYLSGGNVYISKVHYGDDCGCYLVEEPMIMLLDHAKRRAEVIGNIHEHPHLIREEQ